MRIHKVAIIGAGSMAESMISGFLRENLLAPYQITVTNRSCIDRLNHLTNKYGIQSSTHKSDVVIDADLIILAMKPKDIVEGIESIRPYMNETQIVLSVLAGTSIDTIAQLIGLNIPIIRTMPNTSSSVGYSATSLAAGKFVTSQHIELATKLLEAIGTVHVVDEEDLHAATGIAGSGPAYVYYIVEAMQDAANELGLDKEVAIDLISQTLLGAAHMLKNSDLDASTLRRNVTSPGGTTEAGLKQLAAHNVQQAMIACIKSAAQRSRELGRM